MGQVIADVAKDSSTEHSYCCIPVIEKHCVCELVEGCCKCDEEGGGQNEAVLVHWKVMMDAVEKEMGCDTNAIVWEISMRR